MELCTIKFSENDLSQQTGGSANLKNEGAKEIYDESDRIYIPVVNPVKYCN